MLPRPPSSTLFPYTTLFRSYPAADHDAHQHVGQRVHVPAEVKTGMQRGDDQEGQATLHTGFHLDRKSTRLNSSHGYISYAVFCLKKKKKNTQNRTSMH